MTLSSDSSRPSWFVGAGWGGTDDQTDRFLRDGIWENGYEDGEFSEQVDAVRVGDRIAIKARYGRRNNLPFDNHGEYVPGMLIKAVGVVKQNMRDGRILRVDWTRVNPPREWYFSMYAQTIHAVYPGEWKTDALIAFTFNKQEQDINRWRNDPQYRDKFGDHAKPDSRFAWTRFYTEFADRLLQFRHDRRPLADAISQLANRRLELPFAITDRFPDGSTGPLQDICPFTAMGLFNRSLTDTNRLAIATEMAEILGVSEPPPELSTNDDGIPVLNNQRSWFFRFANGRDDGDIDLLWQVFSDAIALAESEENRSAFIRLFDDAQSLPIVRYNLTVGLFWTRPQRFVPLDGNSRSYISNRLDIPISKNVLSGGDYLALCDLLLDSFQYDSFGVHSFPELSWAAYQPPSPTPAPTVPRSTPPADPEPVPEPPPPPAYDINDILADGCFLPRATLETMLNRLRTKRNIILQGPPGAGKTWLSKRLAYALIGNKDTDKVRQVQFHPNLSYEDFVRGWRPQGDGNLKLIDGPFLKLAEDARRDPSTKYVMVIEEINRGNPASIFGELLTLLESDKRGPDDALALAYPRSDSERFHIPPNVYVIGTMNLADRSLALVDIALRRRFAFFDLEPIFNNRWRDWVHEQSSIPTDFLDDVATRITSLNDQIDSDRNLGPQFRIGHSHFTPTPGTATDDANVWFKDVVETEIAPLLREYWFDDADKAETETTKLLSGL